MTKRLVSGQREQGDYAIRRPNFERASDILPNQEKAIERACAMEPCSYQN
ncbi:hypothetical protein DFR29_103311 [Tahibacter aquaticus]|uniref:Uncharacterized protein n=1 Tax=Tahibacter aquaticus TaxID=520092 RepID=A0A4R6Z506_9GAMM|nr:DUF2188 domain-containing protein [Tahibacter aquaticus]TDR46775.1 hypothetical protein DFR29_103311 [Tahibacter aquaticus]